MELFEASQKAGEVGEVYAAIRLEDFVCLSSLRCEWVQCDSDETCRVNVRREVFFGSFESVRKFRHAGNNFLSFLILMRTTRDVIIDKKLLPRHLTASA